MGEMGQPTGRIAIARAETEDEKQRVYRFRYRIYVEEMGKTGLGEADHRRMVVTGPLDRDAMIFYAEAGGEVVATVRINLSGDSGFPSELREAYSEEHFRAFPASSFSFSSRLMVTRGLRGTTALHLLLSHAYERVLERGISFDFCHCAPALVDLYQHLGYRRFTGNFVDPDVGYRVPLVLLTRDSAHLKAVRSPFWRKLSTRPDLWQNSDIARWLDQSFPVASRATELVLNEDGFWHFLASRLHTSARAVPLLDGLDEEQQRRVVKTGTVLDCRAGDAIIRRGDVGNELFVILSGTVEVRMPGAGRPLAVFVQGQVFGEIAFIANVQRSADVVAVTDTQVLVLTQTYLHRLIKGAPELAAKLLLNLSRILCERLVYSSQNWADAVINTRPGPP